MCTVHLVPPDILSGWGRQDTFLTVLLPLAIIVGMLRHGISRARKINDMSARRAVLKLSVASLVCILLAYVVIFGFSFPWSDAIGAWESQSHPELPYSCSFDVIKDAADHARVYTNLLIYLGFVLLLAGGILEARAQVKYNAARSERAMR